MNSQLIVLSFTAASLGFFHTLFGPDHYLPFVVLAKARKWSRAKTMWITLLCGLGHVGSSVVIGFVGIAAGVALSELEYFESFRGNIAGWMFIAFGLAYALWGLRRAVKNGSHTHTHFPLSEESDTKVKYKTLTPWLLFVVFVFGPCEPLIPLLMFPALQHSIVGVASVTAVFSAVTILTMMGVVLIMREGLNFMKFEKMEKYAHTLAGFTIFFSGMAIQFLGL